MPLQEPADDSVAGRIVRVLADRIINGEIAPATPLRQDHVAHEFSASHVPVREAFRRLEARGLVVSEPRRGVRVAPLDFSAIREVAEMRAALEILALRQAAPRITARTLERAEEIADSGDNCGEVTAWEAANRAFHREILTPCGMPRLLATIDELQIVSSRYLFAALKSTGWQPRPDRDHRSILAALREHDIERAATILARHIRSMVRLGAQPVPGLAAPRHAR